MSVYTPIGLGCFLALRSSAQRQAMLPRVVTACGGTGRPVYTREDFAWSDIQPTAGGAYVWTNYDSLVSDCANAGVKIFAIADKTPGWVVGTTGTAAQPCVPLASISTSSGASNAQADYASFCAAIAGRYGPGGTFWIANSSLPYYPITEIEIWNEPYTAGSWKTWNGSAAVTITPSSPTDYASIFSAAASAIHTANASVAAFAAVDVGTANATTIPTSYLIPFLQATSVIPDGLSIHSYPYGYAIAGLSLADMKSDYTVEWGRSWQQFGKVGDIRATCTAMGYPNMPIWITEIGWPSIPSGTVMGASASAAEATQSDRITDLFRTIRSQDRLVQGLIYFSFNNPYFGDQTNQGTYSATNQENWYGLWHTDGSGGVYDGLTNTAKAAVATFTAEATKGLTNSR